MGEKFSEKTAPSNPSVEGPAPGPCATPSQKLVILPRTPSSLISKNSLFS
jgi:hypothetical protein